MKTLKISTIRKEAKRLTSDKDLQKIIENSMIWASSKTVEIQTEDIVYLQYTSGKKIKATRNIIK